MLGVSYSWVLSRSHCASLKYIPLCSPKPNGVLSAGSAKMVIVCATTSYNVGRATDDAAVARLAVKGGPFFILI